MFVKPKDVISDLTAHALMKKTRAWMRDSAHRLRIPVMTQTVVMLRAALNRDEVINVQIESQHLIFSVSLVDSYVS